MKHTPEPWVMGSTTAYGVINPSIVYDAKGSGICGFYRMSINCELDRLTKYDAEGLANVRRTVACVNALAGIPDPAAYVEAVDRARFVLERVSSCGCADDFKRDGTMHCILRGDPSPCIYCDASAALAKLEEVKK